MEGFVRAGGTFSGGTYQSAIHAMGRLRQSVQVGEGAPAARSRARPAAGSAAVRARPTAIRRPGAGSCRSRPSIPRPCCAPPARSSATARTSATATISWSGGCPCSSAWPSAPGALIALAQLPPTRELLLKRPRRPGEGPRPEQREKGWFKVRFVAEGDGRRLGHRGLGRGPRLRRDLEDAGRVGAVPGPRRAAPRAGQLTPAVAMGEPLIARLQRGRDRVPGARAVMALTPQDAAARPHAAFGRHPGSRALHAKGTLCRGRSPPTPDGGRG